MADNYVDSKHKIATIDKAVDDVVENRLVRKIVGAGSPTSNTEGIVGQLYYDTVNKVYWYCTDAQFGVYSWRRQGAGKSAFETAVDGGYKGDEQTFAQTLVSMADIVECLSDAHEYVTGTGEMPELLKKYLDILGGRDEPIQGQPGQPGKSAYEYAVEDGYTGTEAEFASDLAGIGDKLNKDAQAADSALLGGEPPEYYANADALQQSQNALESVQIELSYMQNDVYNVQQTAEDAQVGVNELQTYVNFLQAEMYDAINTVVQLDISSSTMQSDIDNLKEVEPHLQMLIDDIYHRLNAAGIEGF